MKVSRILQLSALAIISTFSSAASGQTVMDCTMQCYHVYNIRVAYCYERYGGYNYDAELCIMNEWDTLDACVRDCETTYGTQAASNLQSLHAWGGRAQCSRS